MPTKKHIQPGEKVPLKLNITQRKFLLNELTCLDPQYEQVIRNTGAGQPVMMTLDDLEDFGGYVAAEANHCENKSKQKRFDTIFQKVQKMLDAYSDEEAPQSIKFEDGKKAKMISDQAVHIGEWTAQALMAAEQLGIKTKPIEQFPLEEGERAVLAMLSIRPKLKEKLLEEPESLTVAEVAGMAMTVAEELSDGEPMQQMAMLMVAKGLMDCLKDRITEAVQPKKQKGAKPRSNPGKLYQFKITLLGIAPPIWRRIQINDCTLDELHEHIQTSMGWTNSHLHQFEIKGERYGDLSILDDGFEDFECMDSTVTMVSEIVPISGKRFAFKYEYDFGDDWEHEVLFEGCPAPEKRRKYPQCIEGERTCPPEDVGGVWGYQEFLGAIADPTHEEHETYLEWCGGSFSPDNFDPKRASREMKKGLPDW